MNQRFAVRGRPSGTDGSDFSYRMVVDSRYTKVAKAKSHLAKLIIVQGYFPDFEIGFKQVVKSKEKPIQLSEVLCLWVVDGNPVASGISCYEQSPIVEAFQNFPSLETLKISAVLLGFVVQLFVIGTTISLIKNMAPPKRAS
ncbi:hypothetical protein R3W88_028764 [Solanum pinnatisectum]|uniref:Uncharacterized protein n=1 Tax=Solanum pinnatisectum TaxID=50273 RepID=A0AAV9K5B6_9SOLN|nr:hypothetical protein R3W88_028764 [Solanum pinnatisectum]